VQPTLVQSGRSRPLSCSFGERTAIGPIRLKRPTAAPPSATSTRTGVLGRRRGIRQRRPSQRPVLVGIRTGAEGPCGVKKLDPPLRPGRSQAGRPGIRLPRCSGQSGTGFCAGCSACWSAAASMSWMSRPLCSATQGPPPRRQASPLQHGGSGVPRSGCSGPIPQPVEELPGRPGHADAMAPGPAQEKKRAWLAAARSSSARSPVQAPDPSAGEGEPQVGVPQDPRGSS
jgi:hypothetical protein